jgi:hypothetical protein
MIAEPSPTNGEGVLIENVAEFAPCETITLDATIAAGELLLRSTT